MSATDTISGQAVKGNWLKVKHNEKLGYVFTGYLYIERSDNFSLGYTAVDSNSVHLIKPGQDCSFNYQYNPNYHYYAVVKSGSTSVLKKTNISFFISRDNQENPGPQVGEYYDYVTDLKDEIHFVIGVRNELKTGKIPFGETYTYQEVPSSTKKDNFLWKEFKDEHLKLELSASPDSYNYDGEYLFDVLVISKIKNNKTVSQNFGASAPFTIIWSGDVDGDGERDLLLRMGDKGGGLYLYLSSYAEPGQLYKEVGIDFLLCC
jgi:hypothetical protein